ncbi:hypothetical protein [Cohnella nanjingensis]|uniref:Uncharacterized protein n=1 Tax=Cohnella nanjingensis TaxID=1387779 RepID=A0A7X0VF86_9BACL|nr:hypothetical protein [Cohnella nanjingensis]MBB6671782.1 hypothetical protein [Cohnella nanjingensis]
MFVLHEYEDAPTKKTGYYVNEGPVTYDEGRQQLTIEANSRIAYVPDIKLESR